MIFHHPAAVVRHAYESRKEKRKLKGTGKSGLKKALFFAAGCLGVALGFLGAVLPLLPAFPFLLLAAVCFARSSEKMDAWLKSTKMYKENLEPFLNGQGMTWKTKIKIMITVTILMSIGFVMMHAVPVGRIVLIGVWIFHIAYFCLGVKNARAIEEIQ
ncbi:MAG: DUF454 family protein [Erysipelotrichaceae bacterium]|nr:DUF454 family protein [Erysipelotrichaceae bacterium]